MTAGDTVAWVALSPLTGRTHQLRAHLHEIDAPVLGDAKYAARQAFPDGVEIDQLMLHAREIAFPHPADGTTVRVSAPLPRHMAEAFQQLGFDAERGEGIYPAEP
jgi:23S rRNA pseudouridine955/2504/2580 synthase